MPHSSGGGSSSGGSHGGSSGGSGGSGRPPINTSSKPFAGSKRYIYYYGGNYHHIYSDTDPSVYYGEPKPKEKAKKQSLILILLAVLIMIFPCFKLYQSTLPISSKDISTEVLIEDNCELIKNKDGLLKVCDEFQKESGVPLAFVTIDDSYKQEFDSLEIYAYDKYIKMFDDEKHWLLVVSYYYDEDRNANIWEFEGMQGDDTDRMLTTSVTSYFNDQFDAALRKYTTDEINLSEAFITAVNATIPKLSSVKLSENIELFGICALVAIIFVITARSSYSNNEKAIQYQNAVEVKEDAKIIEDRCDYCGGTYLIGTTSGTCPYCGAALSPHDEDGNRVAYSTLDSD